MADTTWMPEGPVSETEAEADYARFAAVVGRITFRDWRFLLGISNGRHWLQIEFDAPDSFTDEPGLQRGRKWFLTPHMTNSEVVQTALVAILAATEHETREDFRYRGQAIFGPHFNVESLVALASMDSAQDVRAA